MAVENDSMACMIGRATCFVFAAGLLLAVSPVQAGNPRHPELDIRIRPDRINGLYTCGETATFTIAITESNAPLRVGRATWALSKDNWRPVGGATGDVDVSNPHAVTGTLREPGFLMLEVTLETVDGRRASTTGGAGFEPERLTPSLPLPDNFVEFWAKQKKKLSDLPMHPRLTTVACENASVELYDLQLDCPGGAPVSGYFARPRARQPGTIPAILFVHAAGVRGSNTKEPVAWAGRGALALDINAHGIPNGQPPGFYERLAAGRLQGYARRAGARHEDIYFHGMFMRLMRALDFLAMQPEWDREHLVVSGYSQGGGQAIAAAGLDARVTAIIAGVPALCDHSAMLAGRRPGWPRLVPQTDGTPDPVMLELARYYDAVNFGQVTKARAFFCVGFCDIVCPPASVYSMYNVYQGPKEMFNMPTGGHSGVPAYWKLQPEVLAKFAGIDLNE